MCFLPLGGNTNQPRRGSRWSTFWICVLERTSQCIPHVVISTCSMLKSPLAQLFISSERMRTETSVNRILPRVRRRKQGSSPKVALAANICPAIAESAFTRFCLPATFCDGLAPISTQLYPPRTCRPFQKTRQTKCQRRGEGRKRSLHSRKS